MENNNNIQTENLNSSNNINNNNDNNNNYNENEDSYYTYDSSFSTSFDNITNNNPIQNNTIKTNKYLSEDDTFNPKFPESNSNLKATSIQIGNTILGAGIISLPVVMRYLGIIPGTIFFLVTSAVSTYSVFLLLKAHQMTKKNKYSSIAKKVLGNKGFVFVNLMIILNNFGLCCAYFRIFGNTIQNVISGYVDKDNFLVTNWHNYIYIIFIFIIMFFIVYTDNIEKFEKTSFLGVLGIIIYFIGLYTNFFYKLYNRILPEFPKENYFSSGDFSELITSLPSVFLAYNFHMNVFELYGTLQNRTHRNMMLSTSYSMIFCVFLYILSAYCGYFMYGNSLDDTILAMLLKDMWEYKDSNAFIKATLVITNLGFLMCSTTGIPLMFFTLKKNLFGFIKYYKRKFYLLKREKEKKNGEKNNINDNKNNNIENDGNKNEPIIEKNLNNSNIDDEEENNNNNNNYNEKKENKKYNKTAKKIIKKLKLDFEEANKYEMSEKNKLIVTIFVYCLIVITTILIPNLKSVRI